MALRAEYGQSKPLSGARVAGCAHTLCAHGELMRLERMCSRSHLSIWSYGHRNFTAEERETATSPLK